MTMLEDYPIGTKGTPWGAEEKQQWLSLQTIKRSYQEMVVKPLHDMQKEISDLVIVEQYGALSANADAYALFAVKSRNWVSDRPTILITGGVHGYETSGVLGALGFIDSAFAQYANTFNFVIAPCVSPWGFETINRWNLQAADPNRSFKDDGLTEESANIMAYVKSLQANIISHIDLHETTDTDNSEFRPALSARDAIEQKAWHIPDGFYAVGDSHRPAHDFQTAIIRSVEKVTHIAPADENNQIIGADIEQPGVINYPKKELGLCAGFTEAPLVTTTEVYPDSPRASDEICLQAQVAAVTGALDYIKHQYLPSL